MLFNPLQHMKRAKLLRKKAQSLPHPKNMRALKLAGVHQARARHLAGNPEPLVSPVQPEKPVSTEQPEKPVGAPKLAANDDQAQPQNPESKESLNSSSLAQNESPTPNSPSDEPESA
jgi:hypothetical protein